MDPVSLQTPRGGRKHTEVKKRGHAHFKRVFPKLTSKPERDGS